MQKIHGSCYEERKKNRRVYVEKSQYYEGKQLLERHHRNNIEVKTKNTHIQLSFKKIKYVI